MMMTARTAMHSVVIAALICATSQAALAAPKAPVLTCKAVYDSVVIKTNTLDSQAKIVNASLPSAPKPSAQELKQAQIQAALRAQLLKLSLLALTKVPAGKACDALIAKIDAKFSRS